MTSESQQAASLQQVKDIRQFMERSSRFISLSGLSGIAAGMAALTGAAIAKYGILDKYYDAYASRGSFNGADFRQLVMQLMGVAGGVLAVAFISSFYFTWRKTNKQGQSIWNPVSKRLAWNLIIPLLAGGLFILGMLRYDHWFFVAPACLVFYGLALVNASKYTLTDVRYLGYAEIITGLVSMQWPGYGLYFWAVGFGLLHIIYGITMWWKYERQSV